MYIKEFINYAENQSDRKILKYRYNLRYLMQKNSTFKIEGGSLVFGIYTIDCNKEGQSECDRNLGKRKFSLSTTKWYIFVFTCRSILTIERKVKLNNYCESINLKFARIE